MKRNLILTTILVFVSLANIYSQCDTPAPPGLSCATAVAFCNNEIDGFCSATYNSGVGTNVNMPPFCGSVQNNLWIQFAAGSTSISLEFTIDNCLNGDGLQAMVLHSDDCFNFTGISNCYTSSTSGGGSGTSVFTLDANNYIIGETYYVMIDGWLGDYCDFEINVVQGSTGVAPLTNPVTPQGATAVCPGANSISYSIAPVPGAVSYNWSVPAGANFTLSPDELSIIVNFSAAAQSGNICVEAINDCDVSDQTCLPINLQNLPPTNDYGEYCAGETFFYNGNNTNYTEGTYFITLPGASYQGCDSIVMLEIIENPIKETFLVETICDGNMAEISGILFTETNPNISVTLTSAEGCDSTVYLDLTVLSPEANLQQPEIISCNNQDVFINAALSTADTYVWSTPTGNILSGQGTPIITVDVGGLYELTVSKTHLGVTCTASSSVFVVENYEAPELMVSATNLSCNETNNGSATAVVSGGIPPYAYSWSNGESTPSINNLIQGTYTVTVSGANNCNIEETFIITEPLAMNFSIVLGNISCNGETDGTASVTASGGTSPYSYQWSTGATSTFETGLAPGNYEVTITDANACFLIESFEITEPDQIELSASEIQPFCNGDLGSVTITATGGLGDLNYLWSGTPVQTSSTATNLSVGSHTVTVTDQEGCYEMMTINIQEPPAIELNISGTNPTCNGGINGSANVAAIGGVGTLTYAWNTNPVQNISAIGGLDAGTYEVTVTDQNLCNAIISIDLINPSGMTANFTTQNVLCYGSNTGATTVSIFGGTAPFTYQWDDLFDQTSATASSLSEGNYTVIITDANGCSLESSVVISQPAATIDIVSNSNSATCGSTNGSIDLTVSGGTSPYSYEWTNGVPAVEDPSNLGAGTYSVIVTDANGCSSVSSVAVNTPSGLEAQVDITNTSCFGMDDGMMDVTISGGAAPYSFEWNETANNGNEDFLNITANEYSVTITDNDGCSIVASGIVEQPEELNGFLTPSTASCGISDGTIDVIINGGTAPYYFDWSISAYDGMQDLTDLMPGYYSVLISDANGCSINLAADIIVPDGPSINLVASDAECNGTSTGNLDLTVTGGQEPFTYTWSNSLPNFEDQNFIPAGDYSVTVTDLNNCSAVATATVLEPEAVDISMDFNSTDCFGGTNAEAAAIPSGGVSPYSYEWHDGQTTSIASGLAAGPASITVTDASGCVFSNSIEIPQPQHIEIFYNVTNPTCLGNSDAFIDLVVIGGTEVYTYLWSEGTVTEDANNLEGGVYAVTVTDSNGCSAAVNNILITEPAPISVTSTSTIASCNTANGSIDLTVNGGSGIYTFDWSNGADSVEDPSGLNAGNYSVTINDADGCSVTAMIEVPSPGGLSAAIEAVDIGCFSGIDGSIDLTITGGQAPFTYAWSNTNESIEDQSNLPAGDYSVTILDANNCSTITSATIQEPSNMESVLNSTPATCGEANGTISLDVSGGVAPYSFEWSNGSTLEDQNSLLAGIYSVMISDANGCSFGNSIIVETPNQLSAIILPENVLCNGGNSGSITLEVSGGVAPFTYEWNNGLGTVQNPSGLNAGEYTVTITDAAGCTIFLNTEITEPILMTSVVSSSPEACGMSNGTIDLTMSGGMPPYSFQWQDGIGSMEDPTGLSAGIYNVTVIDANGCEYITNAEIETPAPYFINAITTEVACNGDANATINLNVEGGIPPYSFSWSSGQISEDLENLSEGTYIVTVTDGGGCTINYEVEIEEPTALEAFVLEPINVSCNGVADGSIVLEVVGGTPDYFFDWNVDDLDSLQNPEGLNGGIYEVIVTDLNGCSTTTSATLIEPEVLNVYSTITELTCFGSANGGIDIQVEGGTAPYSYDWNNGSFTNADLIDLAAGQYDLIVTDANGCFSNATYTLESPAENQVIITNSSNYNGFNTSCFGETDGFVQISATGGNAPYSFLWEDGSTLNERIGLTVGQYSVTVLDANSCSTEMQITMTAPEQIISDVENINPSCFGENDGQIIFGTTTGGLAPYVFSIEDGFYSVNQYFDGLTGGGYDISVQDANGCEWSTELILEDPNELVVDLGDEIVVQLGDSIQLDPLMNISMSEVDTFIWRSRSIPELNPWISPTESTNYSLELINENGCVAYDDINVIVKKDRLVYFPNVFTPNNDGVNDFFFPQFGKGVNHVNTFQVFNRWGELVFEKSGYEPGDNTSGWGGYLRGEKAASGVYVYFVEVEFTDGRKEIYSGDFTLFR